MSNIKHNVVNVATILSSQTITTSAVTTEVFDLSGYGNGNFSIIVDVQSNGGAGTIDHKVQYSSTDTVSSGALANAVDLETVYYVDSQRGYKADALALTGRSAETHINYEFAFEKPTLDTAKVPNKYFQVVITPANLTGTNKVTVLLVKHNRV
jgi:hypothetical protein